MRCIGLLVPVVVACSGRSHDAGPTTSPDHATGGRAAAAADGAGSPTVRARPLDGAALDALAAVTVAGHEVTVARRGARDLAAIIAAPGGPRVTVTVSACLACTPVALPAWEARRAELAALWAPADAAGDALTLSAPTVAGVTAIAVDARRTLDGERRHTYQLHWNDGTAQLAAVCETSAPARPDAGATPDDCAAETAAAFAAFIDVLI